MQDKSKQFYRPIRQLTDILLEKKQKAGLSWAKIGAALGGYDGQLIGKYASGKSKPTIDFAIDWKRAFDENLIDLMLNVESQLVVAAEPTEKFLSLREQLTECQQKLIACMEERDALKNFARGNEGKTKLKKG